MSNPRDAESKLWDWLRKGGEKTRNCHLQRIEDTTKLGTPDVEGSIGGTCFWIELKIAKEVPNKKGIRINTTAFQVYFAIKRNRIGGRAWFLIRVGVYPSFKHYLIPGHLLEENYNDLIPTTWLEENSKAFSGATAEQILINACQTIG